MKRQRIVVGMSGGVDSAVAAALLVEQGHEVIGVTMRLWTESRPDELRGHQQCCSVEDIDDARRVAGQLGIRHYVLNFEDAFRDKVVNDFVAEYARGRTPNPCARCNEHIKYRALLDRLPAMDADLLATGHYARVFDEPCHGTRRLLKGVDPEKDQSYVLYMLGQEQLRRLILPIGWMTKAEVREHARRLALDVADKPDSVEICFVPGNDYRTFIAERAPAAPGAVVDLTTGVQVAEHDGLAGYTVGQRKGLGFAAGEPRYVTGLDPVSNTVFVGLEDDLFADTVELEAVSWVSGLEAGTGASLQGKARYRAPAAPVQVVACGPDSATVRFRQPQRALTPGQALCLYDGEDVVGGGTISRAFRS